MLQNELEEKSKAFCIPLVPWVLELTAFNDDVDTVSYQWGLFEVFAVKAEQTRVQPT